MSKPADRPARHALIVAGIRSGDRRVTGTFFHLIA